MELWLEDGKTQQRNSFCARSLVMSSFPIAVCVKSAHTAPSRFSQPRWAQAGFPIRAPSISTPHFFGISFKDLPLFVFFFILWKADRMAFKYIWLLSPP